MTNARVLTSLDERGVFTITLNDTEKRNVLSQALTAELVDAMDRVDSDSAIRVAVLTNSGRIFCAGADLDERMASDGQPGPIDSLALFRRIQLSPKPWVGRIAGHAVAGGTGLAAAVDISVALTDIKMGFTEVRLGIAPAIMSAICLPKMRQGDAKATFLRGAFFDGAEAARLGLITTAVSSVEALDAEVEAVIDDLLLGAPGAFAATKDLFEKVPYMGPEEAITWASARSAELFGSNEAAEGMAAYLEKRPPYWVADEPTADR